MSIITRDEWGAADPRGVGNPLGNPVGITQHWEGPKMGVWDHSLCAGKVRGVQAFHQRVRGWSDIAYNLIVCPHGDAYIGRGADRGNAANGDSSNLTRYSVCALTGLGDPTPDALKAGILDAHAWLRAQSGKPLAVLDCHSDHVSTTCPGPDLRAWVKAGAPRPDGTPASPASAIPTLPKPAPKPTARPRLVVDGILGPNTIRAWQRVMGTPQDGVISKPSLLVKAVQRVVRTPQDGLLGPITWRAIQRRLRVSADGIPGPITISALQRRLNSGNF